MKYLHFPDVEGFDALSLGLEGASAMTVRLLSTDTVCIELAPGGHTPFHQHSDKERVLVISGRGEAAADEERTGLGPGDFVEFAAGERHQIINTFHEALVLICLRNQQ